MIPWYYNEFAAVTNLQVLRIKAWEADVPGGAAIGIIFTEEFCIIPEPGTLLLLGLGGLIGWRHSHRRRR